MSKYGRKFTCWSCGAKFYDLNKPSPKCPKCGSDPTAQPSDSDAVDDFDEAELDDDTIAKIGKGEEE